MTNSTQINQLNAAAGLLAQANPRIAATIIEDFALQHYQRSYRKTMKLSVPNWLKQAQYLINEYNPTEAAL